MLQSKLTSEESGIVYQCMLAVYEHHDWIEDWEFSTRLGIERNDVRSVLEAWPNVAKPDLIVYLAINNSMNEICNGLAINAASWTKEFDFSRSTAVNIYHRWRKALHLLGDDFPRETGDETAASGSE